MTRLPRCREDTQHVFVRCTRDIGSDALTGTVVRVRPELVRGALRSLMSTSPVYADVIFDEDAMRSIEEVDVMNDGGGGSDDEANNDDDGNSKDDNDDESAEHTTDTPYAPAGPCGTAPSSTTSWTKRRATAPLMQILLSGARQLTPPTCSWTSTTTRAASLLTSTNS